MPSKKGELAPIAPAFPFSSEMDPLGLSAVAQEAMGFKDDQFMDLSTSGASICQLRAFPDISWSPSSRFNQSPCRSSLSGVHRRGPPALAPGVKARDESDLSASGMSLSSLGSLSRSASSRRVRYVTLPS